MSVIKNFLKSILCRVKFRNLVKFDSGSVCDLNSSFEGGNKIGSCAEVHKCRLGYGTYISAFSRLEQVQFGKFCSIGKEVKCVYGKHPTKIWVSTHPAFFSTKKQSGFSYVDFQKFSEEENKYGDYRINIGNDVWIGNNVLLMDGINIGNGAIIAAGAVVAKDVPSYAIVGGVPAQTIRMRFEEETIEFLEKIQWWNKGEDWLKMNGKYFSDINIFKQMFDDLGEG